MGIGILPEVAAQDFAPIMGLRLIRLTDSWADRDMHVCVRDLDSLPSAGRQLVEMLVGTDGLRNKRNPA
jgi:DNA-binding transcriptional LysR family regulator